MTKRGDRIAGTGLVVSPQLTDARCPRAHAFTLIELLVTLSIVAILVSLVIPMLGKTVAASRGFKCQQTLRSVAYDFRIFADDNLHGYRGGDTHGQDLPRGRFSLENFVESQYGVDEFWAWPGETRHDTPDAAGNDPMRCPTVKGELILRSNAPCTGGAISPYQNISYGFNIRMHIAEQFNPPGQFPVILTSANLDSADVPLVWDVDGAEAVERDALPLFSGPSLDSPEVFAGDRYWFPGLRHNGAANFAFTDGHVESSGQPLSQEWNWGFTPSRKPR